MSLPIRIPGFSIRTPYHRRKLSHVFIGGDGQIYKFDGTHPAQRMSQPLHPHKSPAGKEVESVHEHYCLKHKDVYPGYAPKCKEPRELLCGGCLAKEFGGIHESQS